MRCGRRGELLFFLGPGFLVLAAVVSPVFGASAPEAPTPPALSIDAREQLRQQERERVLQQQNTPRVDERLLALKPPHPIIPPMKALASSSIPCG
ncbi:hypothetical protein WJ967_27290 [Achromobacter xylosoxidans]